MGSVDVQNSPHFDLLFSLVKPQVGVSVGALEINGSDVSGDLCKYATVLFASVEVFVGNRKQYVFDFFFFSSFLEMIF